jgi:uncharacterized protein DUF3791
MNKKTMEFVSLCIESYKTEYKKSGKDVIELFDDFGVTEFLIEGYDILHTQSIRYVMEEISLYLKNRGYVER